MSAFYLSDVFTEFLTLHHFSAEEGMAVLCLLSDAAGQVPPGTVNLDTLVLPASQQHLHPHIAVAIAKLMQLGLMQKTAIGYTFSMPRLVRFEA